MKKLIFGCVLLLGGILGGTGWVLARAVMAAAHGWVSLSHLFDFGLGDWGTERFFIIAFYLIAIVGAVIAVTSWKKDP